MEDSAKNRYNIENLLYKKSIDAYENNKDEE